MLLTVFADGLVYNEHLASARPGVKSTVLAIQFLDYPLLLLRPKEEAKAGAVVFKSGKAASVAADEREIDFLLSHVPTTVLLLDVSHQPQPSLLATGRVDLQTPSSHQGLVRQAWQMQNVVLCNAKQQPLASVELSASLQTDDSLQTQQTLTQSGLTTQPAAGAPWQSKQVQGFPAAQQQLSAALQPGPAVAPAFPQQQQLNDQVLSVGMQPHIQQPMLDHSRDLNGLSSSHTGLQQPGWPGVQQLQEQQQQYHPTAVVLGHKQENQASCTAGRVQRPFSSPETSPADKRSRQRRGRAEDRAANRDSSLNNAKRQAVSKPAVQAAVLKASQILAGQAAAPRAGAAARKPKQQQQYVSSSRDPDTWSPPPPRPYRKLLNPLAKGSTARGGKQKRPSPAKATNTQQQRMQGLQQLKQQQMQHWHSNAQRHYNQQQLHEHYPALQQHQEYNTQQDSDGAGSSDDCLELEDISCSLSAVLDTAADEQCDYWVPPGQGLNDIHGARRAARGVPGHGPDKWTFCPVGASPGEQAVGGNQQWHTGHVQGYRPAVMATETAAHGHSAAAVNPTVDASHDQGAAANDLAGRQLNVMVQPAMPADWQYPLQQPQPQPLHPAQQQQGSTAGHAAAAAAGDGNVNCHNCAATLSAAAQLIQATQQATAAAAGAAQSNSRVSLQPQQLFQGGVSTATAVVWEMMTLMTLRAVMSQAVNSMAGQLSTAVGQMLQQALGGVGQLIGPAAAAAGSLGVPAAPAAAAAKVQPWLWTQLTPHAVPAAPAVGPAAAAAHSRSTGTQQQAQQAAAAAAQQEQSTSKQLQEQQEELHKQFEQLEALMVVRDDTSSSGSSTGSSKSVSRLGSIRSFRRSTSSPGAVNRLLHSTGSSSPRSSRAWPPDSPEAAAAAAVGDASTSGMIIRLRRSASERRDRPTSPLSRAASTAAGNERLGFSSLEGASAGTNAAAAAAGSSVKQQQSAAAGKSEWMTLAALAPADAAAGASAASAAAAGKRSFGPVTLPPLPRPGSAESSRQATASVQDRRKQNLPTVETSYSESYEADFESPASSGQTSPKQPAPAAGTTNAPTAAAAAAAAAAALDLLHRSVPAVTVTSPKGVGTVVAGRRNSSSGSGGNSSGWQHRSSLKLDRRGSELPEIPEISENYSGEHDSPDGSSAWRQQQQQRLPAANARPAAVIRNDSRGAVTSQTAAMNRTDTLDTLTESIMDELLPPPGVSMSRRNSSNIQTRSLSGSLDWPAAAAANRDPAAGARAMAAALPGNATRRAVLAPITRPTPAAAALAPPAYIARAPAPASTNTTKAAAAAVQGSPSDSLDVGKPKQQEQQQQQLNAVSSFISVDSALDDLLGESDFAMPASTQSTRPAQGTALAVSVEAASPKGPTAAAAGQALPVAVGRQQQQPAVQKQQQGRQQQEAAAAAAASAAQRLSEYSDVSFLSDENEDSPTGAAAAAAAAKPQQQQQQQQQQGRVTRRTESGLSFMSSLDGSDVDINYSIEVPIAAAAAATRSASPSSKQQQQRAGAAGSGRGSNVKTTGSKTTARPQTVPAQAESGGRSTAVTPGSSGGSQKSGGARNAADVFYSHVSGTPAYLAGMVGTRVW